MKKISLIVLLFLPFIIIGQNYLPNEILIEDTYSSPWIGNFKYKYKLKKNKNNYDIIRIYKLENGNKCVKKETIGSIEYNIIEDFIISITTDTMYSIKTEIFDDILNNNNIITSVNSTNNYSLELYEQKQFIINKLKDDDFLKSRLTSYYENYDQSDQIDGDYSKIEVIFTFNNNKILITSESVLEFALPISINGIKHYSTNISEKLNEIIPESNTNRKEILSGNNLINRIISNSIDCYYSQLDSIAISTCCNSTINELQHFFHISDINIDCSYSFNWNGEKRLSCKLKKNDLNFYNIVIAYSVEIENNDEKYSCYEIINKYDSLINKVLSINTFEKLLKDDHSNKISIIFDNNSCFSEKTMNNFMNFNSSIDKNTLQNSLLIIVDTKKDHSYWVVLPNSELIFWENKY